MWLGKLPLRRIPGDEALESRLFERIAELSKRADRSQRILGFVTAANFHGIDINAFAVELAKVTMMIARKLAIDELHISEHALPLDNLDANFIAADALIDEAGSARQWPRADVIIGNPPFLGAKRLKPVRGVKHVNAIRRVYPDVPGMADYCVYWFRKRTIISRLVRRQPRWQVAPAWWARRTCGTINLASVAWITWSRQAQLLRRLTTSPGPVRLTFT